MKQVSRSVVSCALLCTLAGSAAAQSFQAVPLGTLGGLTSNAQGVNSLGMVVGTSDVPGDTRHAFVWQDGVMTDLGTLEGGNYSGALSINDAGTIVGFSTNESGVERPVKWELVGSAWVITDLGTLGGPLGRANRISPAGLIAGYSSPGPGPYRTTIWFSDGSLVGRTPINPPNRNPYNLAYGVNDSGEVVGIEYTPLLGFGDIGVYYSADGVPLNLTPEGNFVTAHPQAINTFGLVAGYMSGPRITSGRDRAGFYNFEEGWIFIPTLPGHDSSQAYSMNDAAHVVGTSYAAFDGPPQAAFLFADGVLTDLNASSTGSPDAITQANDISANDLIAADAQGPDGPLAVLLRPFTGTRCPADFNQDGGVDGADVEAFFIAWESAQSSADVNQDGGVDGADVEFFFIAWQNGGC